VLSQYVLLFCRWSIGLTFLASAIGKARDLPAFRLVVTDLHALPARLAQPAAVGTVLAEALVVLAMAVGFAALPVGFVLAAVLLALFSVVLAAAVRRDVGISCNCFGIGKRPVSWYDLGRNVLLVACCVAGVVSYPIAGHGLPAASVIVLLGLMAGCFSLVVTNLEDIVELVRKPYFIE
jgi:uncharacterized membrane protein YphA (DoxX/SURF4 family)